MLSVVDVEARDGALCCELGQFSTSVGYKRWIPTDTCYKLWMQTLDPSVLVQKVIGSNQPSDLAHKLGR